MFRDFFIIIFLHFSYLYEFQVLSINLPLQGTGLTQLKNSLTKISLCARAKS